MTSEELFTAIGGAEEKDLEHSEKPPAPARFLRSLGAVAACLVLLIGVSGLLFLPKGASSAAPNMSGAAGVDSASTSEARPPAAVEPGESGGSAESSGLPALVPGWLPEGWTLESGEWADGERVLVYRNGEDGAGELTLRYGVREELYGSPAEAEEVLVGGEAGSYCPGADGAADVLVWTDGESGLTFCLTAPLEEAVMLRIAESVGPEE